MKYFSVLLTFFIMAMSSCGKQAPKESVTEKDTLTVEEMEQELQDLETKSQEINNRLDSINNSLNE